jgi:hypothetical protein
MRAAELLSRGLRRLKWPAVVIAAIALYFVVQSERVEMSARGRATGAADTTFAAPDTGAIRVLHASGFVLDFDGRPQENALVQLVAIGDNGNVLWQSSYSTDVATPQDSTRRGRYSIAYPLVRGHAPADLRLRIPRQQVTTGRIKIKGPWIFLSPPYVRIDSLQIGQIRQWAQPDSFSWRPQDLAFATPDLRVDFWLGYDPTPPFYAFLLFVPALVGLVAATTTYMMSQKKVEKGLAAAWVIRRYVIVGTAAWVFVIGWFIAGYWIAGLRSISFLDPKFSIPVLVPVSAFLGVLVYATSCLTDDKARLEDLGNRVFIAPYVAIMAILALFQGKAEGLLPPFIAFVTGLWIEPVMGALRGAGLKLIPDSKGTAQGPPKDRTDANGPLTSANGTRADSTGKTMAPDPT